MLPWVRLQVYFFGGKNPTIVLEQLCVFTFPSTQQLCPCAQAELPAAGTPRWGPGFVPSGSSTAASKARERRRAANRCQAGASGARPEKLGRLLTTEQRSALRQKPPPASLGRGSALTPGRAG